MRGGSKSAIVLPHRLAKLIYKRGKKAIIMEIRDATRVRAAVRSSQEFRRRAVTMLAGLTFAIVAVLAAPIAKASPEAEAFVQQNVEVGYGILNNEALPQAERRAQFRDFMISLTDSNRIGTFTLGQYARSGTPEQVRDFLDAFTDYAVAVYESRLGEYRGQTLQVTGSVDRAADDSVVEAIVVGPNSSAAMPIRVGFRVRKDANGNPIVIDMQIEGVWLAINQRSDFTAFLQQNGGNVSALAEHLRRQTAQILSGTPPA